MVWLSLVLGLVQNFPALLRLTEEVIDLIRGKACPDEKKALERELIGLVSTWYLERDDEKLASGLKSLKARL